MSSFLKGALTGGIGAAAVLAASAAVAGTGVGGIFNLGQQNTVNASSQLVGTTADAQLQVSNAGTGASSRAISSYSTSPTAGTLYARNGGGGPAAAFSTDPAAAPFNVSSATKVRYLNADLFDNYDASAFLRKGVGETAAVTSAGGVLSVTNTGTTNGVQGRTESAVASGVYGEHIGSGGFGVAGRAGDSGNAIYGDNTGTGYAGYFADKVFVGGNLECTGCVDAGDVSGKVNDSDKLDGIDSSGFVQGAGKAVGQALVEDPGTHHFLGPPIAGFLRLSYACPSNTADQGALRIYNDSGDIANVFEETNSNAHPYYFQLAPGQAIPARGAIGSGESFHIQAQGPLGVLTIEVATVNRATNCHAQAQGLLTG